MNNPEDLDELDKRIEEESRKKPGKILLCPQCGSNHTTYYMGMKTGVQYQCKDCDYVGSFIIEQDKY